MTYQGRKVHPGKRWLAADCSEIEQDKREYEASQAPALLRRLARTILNLVCPSNHEKADLNSVSAKADEQKYAECKKMKLTHERLARDLKHERG
jgi:hypothetical protein